MGRVIKFLLILLTTAYLPNLVLSQNGYANHVQGEVLIRLNAKYSIDRVVGDLQFVDNQRTQFKAKELLSNHMQIWHLTYDESVLSSARALEVVLGHPGVHNAQLNYILEKRVVPNDTEYNQQWQYEQPSDIDLDAEAAWDITTGGVTAMGDTIVVCVIDDGLQVNHPDWGNNIWYNNGEIPGNGIDDDGNGYIDDFRGWNADDGTNDIVAGGFANHGTPVAGIVAAQGNNGVGVTGVNWDVKLMFVVGGGTSANSIAAYNYPFECRKLYNQTNGSLGAFVVATNASWGVDNQQCATYAPLVNEFYDTLGAYGVLNCAATANANTNVDVAGDFPTSCASNYLISVTNMNQSGTKVTSAGYGATTIDLGAFGQDTYTLTTGSGYGGFGGTSGATPHVAGTIGLLYSSPCPTFALLAKNDPQQTALLAKNIILNTTVPNASLSGITVTEGILNMKNAIDSVMAMNCSLSGCHEPFFLDPITITGTSIEFNWNGVAVASSYHVVYREVGGGSWSHMTSVDTFTTINSLTACTNYEIMVSTDCDSSLFSFPITVKTGDCCDAPNAITINSIGLTDASISWNSDAFVNYYQYEYKKTSETVWVTDTTSMANVALSNLDSCETYQFRIISNCSVNVNNEYSDTIIIQMEGCGNCSSQNYCSSSYNAQDDWIDNVTLESINNTTGNNNGYADFTSGGPTTDLMQGANYPISIDFGYNSGPWATNWRLKVWIDYNQDDVFDDATEVAFDAGQISTATTNQTGTISIPLNASMMTTKMRVALRWGTTAVNPCNTNGYGEVEDYCVNIVAYNGFEDLSKNDLAKIYPNPSNGIYNVELFNYDSNVNYQILTTDGKVIESGKIQNKNFTIDLKERSNGIYLINISSNKINQTFKLLKE